MTPEDRDPKNPTSRARPPKPDWNQNSEPARQAEIRQLAEEIIEHCPSLTQLLLAIGSKNRIMGLN